MTPAKLLFLFGAISSCTLYLLYLVKKRDIKGCLPRLRDHLGFGVALKTGFQFKYDKIALNCFW